MSIFLPKANTHSLLSGSAHFYSMGLISEEGDREISVPQRLSQSFVIAFCTERLLQISSLYQDFRTSESANAFLNEHWHSSCINAQRSLLQMDLDVE